MKITVKRKLTFLKRHFGFRDNELTEIKKMYSGEFFNPQDKAYLRLLTLSYSICQEYSSLASGLNPDCSLLEIINNTIKKRKKLRLLFPFSSPFLLVGPGIKTVIGICDCPKAGFFNNRITFNPTALYNFSAGFRFGPLVELGDKKAEHDNQGRIRFKTTNIDQDCWVGYGAKIASGLHLHEGTIIGAGAEVIADSPANSLLLGRSAVLKKTIPPETTYNFKPQLAYTDEEKERLKLHLKKLGFSSCYKKYEEYLEGKPSNVCSPSLSKLFLYTHRLCFELNRKETTPERKQEIIDLLFPLKGKNVQVEEGIYIDMLGAVRLGNDVKISKGVCLTGNIVIEDGAMIGENALLFASGHPLGAKKRRFRFSLLKGLYEEAYLYSILIRKNAKIGSGAIIVPSCQVQGEVEENSLCLGKPI